MAGEWRSDPNGRYEYRWWDQDWTEHVATEGHQATDSWSQRNLGKPPPLTERQTQRAREVHLELVEMNADTGLRHRAKDEMRLAEQIARRMKHGDRLLARYGAELENSLIRQPATLYYSAEALFHVGPNKTVQWYVWRSEIRSIEHDGGYVIVVRFRGGNRRVCFGRDTQNAAHTAWLQDPEGRARAGRVHQILVDWLRTGE